MLRRLLPDPFLLFLLGTVALASLLPAQGPVATIVGWLATATVVLLFFVHGGKLAREQVLAGLVHWRLHATILACTFVAFPLVALAARTALPRLLAPELWTGILFLAALPSTVQSSIAFVSMARGNVPAAVASASASQMLGVVLTPVLMGLMAGAHGRGIDLAGMGKVGAEVLAPFVAGHLLRPWLGPWIARHKALVGLTDRSTILISVYSAFSAAVLEGLWHRLPLDALGVLALVAAALLALAFAFTWWIGGALRFPRDDRVAILFCGTKKSLVQGVPMARVLFPGPEAGLILLPIMIFHQLQLMAGAFIARRLAESDDVRA